MNSCCPKDSLGCLQTPVENLKGQTQTVNDMRIYHVGSGPRAILMIYDIFGFDFGLERQFCDYLSTQGFQVFMADYYKAEAYPNKPIGPDLKDFILKNDFEGTVKPMLQNDVLPFIKSKGVTELGLLGFCWGAWLAFHIMNSPELNSIVKCCASAHPSLKVEDFHGRPTLGIVKNVKLPVMLIPTVNEMDRVKPNGEFIKILCENLGEDVAASDVTNVEIENVDFKKKMFVNYFENMTHGFASRGDLKDAEVRKSLARTHQLLVGFFNAHV